MTGSRPARRGILFRSLDDAQKRLSGGGRRRIMLVPACVTAGDARRAADRAAQGDRPMTDRQSAISLRTAHLALEPGVAPHVLMPGSTSFDSRGP